MSKRAVSPVSADIAAAKIRESSERDYGYSPEKSYVFSILLTRANFRFNLVRNKFEFVESEAALARLFADRTDIDRSLIIDCLQTINEFTQTLLKFYTRQGEHQATLANDM